MPLQYSGILEEHRAVREAAGLFDISHMGEVLVRGANAEAFLNRLLTNDISQISVGAAQYNLMCNDRGGILDDLFVYRLAPGQFALVINAGRIQPDVDWIRTQNSPPAVSIEDASDRISALALQGPRAAAILERLLPGVSARLPRHRILQETHQGVTVLVARTGYTGEDGFEIFLPAQHAAAAWNLLLQTGADLGLKPCGLGARDTLRLEMGYPLYGNDLTEETTPIEADLGKFVATGKEDFVGKEILQQQKSSGTSKRLMAFRMSEKGPPPRPHYPILAESGKIGEVTSGTLSPSLDIGIGMGYVESAFARIGQPVAIEIRGRPHAALLAAKPMYRKP